MPLDITNIIHTNAPKEKRESSALTSILVFLNKDITLLSKSLSDKKKLNFYSELQILLSSGIDIKTTLEIIIDEQKKEKDKVLFTTILEHIIQGSGLSEAIKKCGRFSLYEYHSLRIGEESGKLNEVLLELNRYYTGRIKQKRQISSALTYPLLVLFTAIISMIFMMSFVVPMFSDVFTRMQGELPGITLFIIKLSGSMNRYICLTLLIIILLILFIMMFKKKSWYRHLTSSLLLMLPVVKGMMKKMYLSRYCRSMSLLLGSKTPILTSIQLVKEMIGFYPFERALAEMEEKIMQGHHLHRLMSNYAIFDKRIVALTKVAEEVNQLDTVYTTLTAQYTEELEHRLNMLSHVLEPLLIIFVGLIVGFILVAMYMPIFQLSTGIF